MLLIILVKLQTTTHFSKSSFNHFQIFRIIFFSRCHPQFLLCSHKWSPGQQNNNVFSNIVCKPGKSLQTPSRICSFLLNVLRISLILNPYSNFSRKNVYRIFMIYLWQLYQMFCYTRSTLLSYSKLSVIFLTLFSQKLRWK